MNKATGLFKRSRLSPEAIQYAVWLYHRFNLSHRYIEDLLAAHGITVSYELIPPWSDKSGSEYTNRLKCRHQGFGDTFHINEVFVERTGMHRSLTRVGW
jgi:putative transposase